MENIIESTVYLENIPIVFHNGSNNYHFIIKELTKEFGGQLTCLGENTKKYIAISGPTVKEDTRIEKKRSHKLYHTD